MQARVAETAAALAERRLRPLTITNAMPSPGAVVESWSRNRNDVLNDFLGSTMVFLVNALPVWPASGDMMVRVLPMWNASPFSCRPFTLVKFR